MLSYVFSNGIILDNERIFSQLLKGTSTNNVLTFGTIASQYLELCLDNTDGFFDNYSFKNCYINIYDDITGQDVLKLKVYIDSAKEKNKLLTIKAYDKIAQLDKTWIECKVPITLYDFIKDICNQCNIIMNAFNLPNLGYKIQNVEELKGKTCRECLSYALEICGTYAYLNSKEVLTFKWFDFNKAIIIDESKLIDYNTDLENSIVDNIYFIRGSKCYQTNNNPKGSIYITKDNPLLKECSSNKVYSIINNLQKRVDFSYLPCNIKAADYFTYNIGDVVKFIDYKSNERYAIVGTVSFSAYNDVTINSPNVDEQDISGSETSSSVSNTDNTINGELTFYRKINNPNMEYKECNDTTQIQYFMNANCSSNDSIQIVVNNIPYKTFNVKQGNNTIALMLKGDIIDDSITTIDIITQNTLEDIEVNSIFKNCLVIDYDEDDEKISCGEYKVTLPNNCYAYECMNNYFDVGIQGWMYKEEDIIINNTKGKWSGLFFNGKKVDENNVYFDDEFEYFPELHTTKQKDLYLDAKKSKHYIQVSFNGSYIDRWGNEVKFENYIPNGELGMICYKKSSDTTNSYWGTTTGIIEVEDDEKISFCMVYQVAKEPTISKDDIKITIQLLDEDLEMSYIGDTVNRNVYLKEMLDNDNTTIIKVENPITNSNNSQYIQYTWVGDWKYKNVNSFTFDDLSCFTINCYELTNTFMIYRNYSSKGWEKFEEID